MLLHVELSLFFNTQQVIDCTAYVRYGVSSLFVSATHNTKQQRWCNMFDVHKCYPTMFLSPAWSGGLPNTPRRWENIISRTAWTDGRKHQDSLSYWPEEWDLLQLSALLLLSQDPTLPLLISEPCIDSLCIHSLASWNGMLVLFDYLGVQSSIFMSVWVDPQQCSGAKSEQMTFF